jgi:ABC-2 type transport system ATP-binding protein
MLTLFGLWDRSRDRVRSLSGGLRRRLEIARGLLHSPKLLFLDEPTLGLDADSRHRLWALVKRMNAADGVTVFLTTHYMDECERVAHRVAIIDRGRIIASGSPRDLREQAGAAESLEAAFLALTAAAPPEAGAAARHPAAKLAAGSQR